MGKQTRIIASLVSILLLVNSPGVVGVASAGISEAAVLFLVISNFPRANGMGITPITVVDPQSTPYNPGALGILHLDRLVAVTFPHSTQWLPGLADDLVLKTYNVSGGISRRLLTGKGGRFNASLGLGYSRLELDLGTQTRVDEFGNVLGEFGTYEHADLYTVSAAIQYCVRIGVGLTYKDIRSVLSDQGAGAEQGLGTADGTATDVGLYVELPVRELLAPESQPGASGRFALYFDLTPAFSYVNINSGDDVSYIDAAQADPLPHMERIGASVFGAARIGRAEAVSARFAWQKDRSLVGEEETPMEGRGAEVGLLGTVYYRWGRYEDPDGHVLIDTKGYGLSLSGALKWLGVIRQRPSEGGMLKYIREHLDVTYDHAEYTQDDGGPLDATDFTAVTLLF